MFGLDLTMIFGGIGAVIIAILGFYAKTQSVRAERAEQERDEAESEANSVYQRLESQEAIAQIKQSYAEKQKDVENSNPSGNNVVDNSMWNDD